MLFRIILLFDILCLSTIVNASKSSDKRPKEKFRFEKLNTTKTKYVKKGAFITLYFTEVDSDTTDNVSGKLIELTDTTIIIEEEDKFLYFDNDSQYSYSSSFIYQPKTTTYSKDQVKYVWKDAKTRSSGLVLGTASLISAIIVAPIVAIDKIKTEGFDVAQYKQITFGSLVSSAVGFLSEPILDGCWLKIPTQ